MTSKTKKWLIAGGVVLAIIVLCNLGSSDSSSSSSDIASSENASGQSSEASIAEEVIQTVAEKVIQKEEAIVISPRTLYSEYKENEVAADMKYKGKLLRIKGKVDSIGKDILDDPYLTFSIDFLESINFYFDEDNESEIANCRKGQTLAIEGRCSGLFATTSVIMSDCKIVQ